MENKQRRQQNDRQNDRHIPEQVRKKNHENKDRVRNEDLLIRTKMRPISEEEMEVHWAYTETRSNQWL